MNRILIFLIYLGGLGSLFASDILVTKYFPTEQISIWAEVRSLVGIGGVLCLIGLDQVFMRSRESSNRIAKILSLQIPFLAVAVGGLIFYVGYLSSWLVGSTLVAGSAASLALFQYYRTDNMGLNSQIAQQGWKILLAALISVSVVAKIPISLDVATAFVIFICSLLLAIYALLTSLKKGCSQAPAPVSCLYGIGLRFMVTSLLFAFSLYAEQLAVNKFAGNDLGALYFTHATYFAFPVSILNGYFAFLIGPWIRDNHDNFLSLFRRKYAYVIFFVVLCCLFLNLIGWAMWQIFSPSVGDINLALQFIFLLSCIARTFDSLPSAYNGIFGSPRQHDIYIYCQIMLLAVIGLLFILARDIFLDSIIYLIAVASLLNWLFRALIGFGVSYVIIRGKK